MLHVKFLSYEILMALNLFIWPELIFTHDDDYRDEF